MPESIARLSTWARSDDRGAPVGRPMDRRTGGPSAPGHVAEQIEIENQAVATSGGYGTQFDREGRFNHLFDPATGETSWRYLSVSVIASDATTADALSTAFSLMRLDSVKSVVAALGLKAHLVMPDGSGIWLGVPGIVAAPPQRPVSR